MDDLIEILVQFRAEHMSDILEQDEEHRAARLHETEVHDRFEKTLTNEQIQLFNNFISAASETTANIERIFYQQGMKDMFALFKALS